MCLNFKKIDKNNKTLLGLKARSVNELKKIPESHIFKITVSLTPKQCLEETYYNIASSLISWVWKKYYSKKI